MNRKIFNNWELSMYKDFSDANKILIEIKDNKTKEKCRQYIENQKIIIKAKKLMRRERIESILRLGGLENE